MRAGETLGDAVNMLFGEDEGATKHAVAPAAEVYPAAHSEQLMEPAELE